MRWPILSLLLVEAGIVVIRYDRFELYRLIILYNILYNFLGAKGKRARKTTAATTCQVSGGWSAVALMSWRGGG